MKNLRKFIASIGIKPYSKVGKKVVKMVRALGEYERQRRINRAA